MRKRDHKRWRLLADLPVQGGLLLRIAGYWLFSQLAFIGTIAIYDFLASGQAQQSGSLRLMQPALFASFLVMLICLLEMVMFSNRFAGPLVNLRNKMKSLANSEPVEEARLRPGDFYEELGKSFNQLRTLQLDSTIRDEFDSTGSPQSESVADGKVLNVHS